MKVLYSEAAGQSAGSSMGALHVRGKKYKVFLSVAAADI
jgi:hypothetical protein